MSIPRERHENIRTDQQHDRQPAGLSKVRHRETVRSNSGIEREFYVRTKTSSHRPPWEKTPHLSGATDFASIDTTMHWLPNFSAPARIRSGLASAEELMLILSAPARSIAYMSSTDFIPPPTVSGMKH